MGNSDNLEIAPSPELFRLSKFDCTIITIIFILYGDPSSSFPPLERSLHGIRFRRGQKGERRIRKGEKRLSFLPEENGILDHFSAPCNSKCSTVPQLNRPTTGFPHAPKYYFLILVFLAQAGTCHLARVDFRNVFITNRKLCNILKYMANRTVQYRNFSVLYCHCVIQGHHAKRLNCVIRETGDKRSRKRVSISTSYL